jgi:hypothetical protein
MLAAARLIVLERAEQEEERHSYGNHREAL